MKEPMEKHFVTTAAVDMPEARRDFPDVLESIRRLEEDNEAAKRRLGEELVMEIGLHRKAVLRVLHMECWVHPEQSERTKRTRR